MIRQSLISWGEGVIEEGLAQSEGWSEIVDDLVAEGLNDEEVAALLRSRNAWLMEALNRKAEGWPYDEIVFHLVSLKATWGDVGRVLMTAGLPPADMLRSVLPCTEDEEPWAVIQAALLDGPEDADYEEVRSVVAYYVDEKEALDRMVLEGPQRARAEQRLGLSA